MEKDIKQKIVNYWTELLDAHSSQEDINKDSQYSLQDCGIIISQIIEPTIDILLLLGVIYNKNGVFIKTKKKDEKADIQTINECKSKIESILDNYCIFDIHVDDVLQQIKKKILDSNSKD